MTKVRNLIGLGALLAEVSTHATATTKLTFQLGSSAASSFVTPADTEWDVIRDQDYTFPAFASCDAGGYADSGTASDAAGTNTGHSDASACHKALVGAAQASPVNVGFQPPLDSNSDNLFASSECGATGAANTKTLTGAIKVVTPLSTASVSGSTIVLTKVSVAASPTAAVASVVGAFEVVSACTGEKDYKGERQGCGSFNAADTNSISLLHSLMAPAAASANGPGQLNCFVGDATSAAAYGAALTIGAADGQAALAQVTVAKNGADSTYFGGLQLKFTVSRAVLTAHTGSLAVLTNANGLDVFTVTQGIVSGSDNLATTGNPHVVDGGNTANNSICSIIKSKIATAWQYQSGTAATTADHQFLCYDGEDFTPGNAEAAQKVTMSFLNNWDRMVVYQALQVASVTDAGTASTADTNTHWGTSTAETRITGVGAVTIVDSAGLAAADTFSTSVEIECEVVRTEATWFTTDNAMTKEVLAEWYDASAVPKAYTGSFSTKIMTATFWSDEELKRALQRLYTGRGTTTCGRWKPKTIKCASCNIDTTAEHTVPMYTWTVEKANAAADTPAPQWEAGATGTGAAGQNALYTGLGETDSACGQVESLVGVEKVIYCLPASSRASREAVTIAFFDQVDAESMVAIANVAAATPATDSAAASGFSTATTGDYYYMEWEVSVASSPSVTIAASPGAITTQHSACEALQEQTTGNAAVYCTSPDTGDKMTLYYATKDARFKAARAIRARGTNDFNSAKPTAASGAALQTYTFNSVRMDGATAKHETAYTATHTADTAVTHGSGTACLDFLEAAGAGDSAASLSVWCSGSAATTATVEVMYLMSALPSVMDASMTVDPLTGDIMVQSELRLVMSVAAVAEQDGTPAVAAFKQITWAATTSLYTIEYDVTKAATYSSTIPPSSLGVVTGASNSACAWANSAVAKTVYCSSTSSRLTIGWLFSEQREQDAFQVGRQAANTQVGSATPTKVMDEGTASTNWTQVTMIQGPAFTEASSGVATAADSACAVISADGTITGNTALMYCDSAKDAGSEMTLMWLRPASAIADMKLIYAFYATGTGTDSIPIATVKDDHEGFYTAVYTVVAYVDDANETTVLKASTGSSEDRALSPCATLMALEAVSCVSTPTSATLYFMSMADRAAYAKQLVGLDLAASTTVKMKSAKLESAKDAADEASMISLSYTTLTDETTPFVSSQNSNTANSACSLANAADIVFCDSDAGSMELKWFLESPATGAEPYIASAQSVAAQTYTTSDEAVVNSFTISGATPDFVNLVFAVAEATTTTAPTSGRRSLAVGDAASTGGLETAESWCTTATGAANAVFCTSEATAASGSITLTYAQSALAVADAKALKAQTDYDITLQADAEKTVTLVVTLVASVTQDELCAQIPSAIEWADCSHPPLTIEEASSSRQRALQSDSLDILLSFATAADMAAATTVVGAADFDYSTIDSRISAGSLAGQPSPGNGNGGEDGDPDDGGSDDGASATALRMVGAGLVMSLIAAM